MSYFGVKKRWTRLRFLHAINTFNGRHLVALNDYLVDVRFQSLQPKIFQTPFMRLKELVFVRVHERSESRVFLTLQHGRFVNKIQALVMQFAYNSGTPVSFRHRGKNTMYIECNHEIATMEEVEVFENTEIRLDFALRISRTKKGIVVRPYVVQIKDLIY